MNIFVDTNILLGLYHLSGPDLEELKKIVKLAENNQITVHLPQQVVDEFWKNRERVIRDALDTFTKTKAVQFLPNIVRSNPKANDLRKAVDQVNALAKTLREETEAEINENKLAADKIVESFLKQRKPVPPEVIQKAILRNQLGNPPGKAGSLGDAINWEWLLSQADSFDDLKIVSADSDFESELISGSPKEFLLREWEDIAPFGTLTLFKSLPEFLKTHFPEIKLADEIDKIAAIQRLENSLSFAATHSAIARLYKFDDFTDQEITRIADAYVNNSQIHMILGDSDVEAFAKKIIPLAKSDEAKEAISSIQKMLGQIDEPDNDEDIPF